MIKIMIMIINMIIHIIGFEVPGRPTLHAAGFSLLKIFVPEIPGSRFRAKEPKHVFKSSRDHLITCLRFLQTLD